MGNRWVKWSGLNVKMKKSPPPPAGEGSPRPRGPLQIQGVELILRGFIGSPAHAFQATAVLANVKLNVNDPEALALGAFAHIFKVELAGQPVAWDLKSCLVHSHAKMPGHDS